MVLLSPWSSFFREFENGFVFVRRFHVLSLSLITQAKIGEISLPEYLAAWLESFSGSLLMSHEYVMCSVRRASHAAQVRMQTQTVGNSSVRYSGLFSCMHHLWRTEGPLVFYRGILPPLAAVAGVNSLLFGSYGALRRILQKDPNTPLTLSEIGVCGNFKNWYEAEFVFPQDLPPALHVALSMSRASLSKFACRFRPVLLGHS